MSVYKTDDVVWCYRCKRMESVGAVFHDGPYTTENSRLVERAEDRVYDSPAPEPTGDLRLTSPSGVCAVCARPVTGSRRLCGACAARRAT